MSEKTLRNIRLSDGSRWEADETYDDGIDLYILLKQIGKSGSKRILARIDGDDLVFLGACDCDIEEAIRRIREKG